MLYYFKQYGVSTFIVVPFIQTVKHFEFDLKCCRKNYKASVEPDLRMILITPPHYVSDEKYTDII